jgi:hypothetical protein
MVKLWIKKHLCSDHGNVKKTYIISSNTTGRLIENEGQKLYEVMKRGRKIDIFEKMKYVVGETRIFQIESIWKTRWNMAIFCWENAIQ